MGVTACPVCGTPDRVHNYPHHNCAEKIAQLCKCIERGGITHEEFGVTHYSDCEWLYHPKGGNLGTPQAAIDILDAHINKRYPKTRTFTCPECDMTSYNPRDAQENYCGNCHRWFP